MKLLSDRELNIIRGKALVGHASRDEIMSVFGHIDAMEEKLDETEQDDFYGTEGWRRFFGHPDAE